MDNTVILMWNPAFSSFKMDRFLGGLAEWPAFGLNWSVWEHEQVHKWDRFYMIRVGECNTGVVMSGYVVSEPYRDEDWSGKGRETYYIDLRIDVMLNPELCPLLSTNELTELLPDFDWSGGHSGRILPQGDMAKLNNIWEQHLERNKDKFADKSKCVRRNEINPEDMLYCLKESLDAHNYQYEVHTNADEGFDYLDDISYCITLKNEDCEEIRIDLEGQFTLSYAGWHTHYLPYLAEYEELLLDIMAILMNKACSIVCLVDGKWFGSYFSDEPIKTAQQANRVINKIYGDSPDFINKIHRKGVEIKSSFWDSSMDGRFVFAPGEFTVTGGIGNKKKK